MYVLLMKQKVPFLSLTYYYFFLNRGAVITISSLCTRPSFQNSALLVFIYSFLVIEALLLKSQQNININDKTARRSMKGKDYK